MKKLLNFLDGYNKEFQSLLSMNTLEQKKIIKLFHQVTKLEKKNKKIIIAGNGGSAAIASHFSVDMTKNGGIRCINFNESDLLTCFSNDYGYEKWVEKSLLFYADKGDVIILISSSGTSKNMVNAAKFARKNKNYVATLTGFYGKNPLSKIGDLNFTVNSKNYNLIENVHQYILLSLVDLSTKFYLK
tara:strand:+ start:620 stop:1180 length:561 start_codon:yes stop_codon:yes gene_type:complete